MTSHALPVKTAVARSEVLLFLLQDTYVDPAVSAEHDRSLN